MDGRPRLQRQRSNKNSNGGGCYSLDVDQLKSNTLVPAPNEVVAIVAQLPSA
jgi:hypothetical protein